MRFFAVTRPVSTGPGPNQLVTGRDRSCWGRRQFVVVKYIYFKLHMHGDLCMLLITGLTVFISDCYLDVGDKDMPRARK